MNQLRFDLSDLQAMVAVVEQGGFRAAALTLNLSQPALSRRVAKLEQALDAKLFERTTRRVSLTLVGREFFDKAVEILNGVEASLHNISGISLRHYGEVAVACVPSVAHHMLPPVLRRFHDEFPKIRIRVIDEGSAEVLSHVLRGGCDFGVNFLGGQEPGIDFEPILRERFVLACPPDHPLARKRTVDWDDIGAHPYMTVAQTSGNRLLLDRARRPADQRVPGFIEVQHVSTLLEMVKAGLGVAVVPQLAMHDGDGLRAVPLKNQNLHRTLGVIRRAGHVLSPGAERLVELLKQSLARRPAAAKAGNPAGQTGYVG